MDTNNTKDTPESLREVHSLLVQAMAKKLKSGEELKASTLDVIRKFLLDNDVRVEDPNEYLEELHGMMGDGNDGNNGCRENHSGLNGASDPANYMQDYFDSLDNRYPSSRTGTEETNGYGFQM